MKPQDIIVLLKIFLKEPGEWTLARLAHELFISKSEVSQAIKRLKTSGLARDSISRKCAVPNTGAMEEFLLYGLKYTFPATSGKETRGMPTSHSAPPLSNLIAENDGDVYVWPYEFGNARGKSVPPLYKSVPKAAEVDGDFYELLTILDGIRTGRAREIATSSEELVNRIKNGAERFTNAY
jgi:hypothetical protein